MADYIIDVQLKLPGGVKTPVVTGDKKLTFINLAKLIWGGLGAGKAYGLGASDAYLQVQSSVVQATNTAVLAAVQANDTISIGGTALTATKKRASGTLTAASVQANDTFAINGVTFTAVNGTVTEGDPTFDCSGTDTECATSIAAQVNAYASPLISGLVAATSASAVATLYAITQGTAGNSITLTGTPVRLAASGSGTLAGGAALTNNTFDFTTNALAADALAYAINNSTTAAIKQVTATSDGVDTVTVTAKVGGLAGNTITFESSNGTRIDVGAAGVLENGSAGAVTRWSL